MRALGWVLLLLGFASVVLFLLALAGGASLPAAAWLAAAILIALGNSLRTAAARRPSAGGAPEAESRAVQLPLTPETRLLLERQRARERRLYVVLGWAGCVFFVALAVFVQLSSGFVPSGLLIITGSGAGYALMVAAAWLLSRGRPFFKDLEEDTYLRSAGAIRLSSPGSATTLLSLGDRSFFIYQRDAARSLTGVTWAEIDYSRHAHVIFGARDRTGRVIFRLEGYSIFDPHSASSSR